MSSNLVSVLHQEERSIVAELRASKPFQRLEAIRRLLTLYDAQPSVATGLDLPAGADTDRMSGEVIRLTNAVSASAGAPPAQPAPMSAATHMPATPAPQASAVSLAVPVMAPPPAPVTNTIPLGGPALAPAPQVAAVAEAAMADVVMRAPSYGSSGDSETSSVVSSVRAALMGIGKG